MYFKIHAQVLLVALLSHACDSEDLGAIQEGDPASTEVAGKADDIIERPDASAASCTSLDISQISGCGDPATVMIWANAGVDSWLNFRTNSNAGRAGAIFSKTSDDHYFLYNNHNHLYFAHSTEASDSPDILHSSVNQIMTFAPNGNVGINQILPEHELDVAGTIRAKKIVVENFIGADFVFEPAYPLMPLPDLAKYVAARRHLPGVQPATEMARTGVSIGEQQTVLLQKIEELTLYTIEQHQRLEEQDKKIEKLETAFRRAASEALPPTVPAPR